MEEQKIGDNQEELFEVWMRIKPFRKFDKGAPGFLGEKNGMNGEGRSKGKFKVKGKWAQSEIQKRENDYKAIFTSSCKKELHIR